MVEQNGHHLVNPTHPLGPPPLPPNLQHQTAAQLGYGLPAQVAVEGCCHGDLDKIYATLQSLESAQRKQIDLLICCGDFQVLAGGPVAAHTRRTDLRSSCLKVSSA